MNAVTQLDKCCIDPGIQPPFPAWRSRSCPSDALDGQTGSTGHRGGVACRFLAKGALPATYSRRIIVQQSKTAAECVPSSGLGRSHRHRRRGRAALVWKRICGAERERQPPASVRSQDAVQQMFSLPEE